LRADAAKPISAQDALYAAIKDGHFFWTISPRRSPNIKRSLISLPRIITPTLHDLLSTCSR
jgi:hypothetical protein